MRVARVLIKVFLVAAIVLFALFNYKIITFKHGISKHQTDGNNVMESMQTLTDVISVKYYNKISSSKGDSESNKYKYRVFIETESDAFLLDATQAELDAFKAVGNLSARYKPQQIKPIPFYVEIIVGAIVVLFPPFELIQKLRNKNKSKAKKK